MPTPAESTDEVNVSFTMSNDRSVITLVLSHTTEISNIMLSNIFARHAAVLLEELQ